MRTGRRARAPSTHPQGEESAHVHPPFPHLRSPRRCRRGAGRARAGRRRRRPATATTATCRASPVAPCCRSRPTPMAPAGAGLVTPANDPDGDGKTVINGIQFPTPSQPVEGFSGIVEGAGPASGWRWPTTATAARPNSRDFNIRAYYVPSKPRLRDGVRDGIEFSDRRSVRFDIEFTGPPSACSRVPRSINEGRAERVLTGGDIDLESVSESARRHAVGRRRVRSVLDPADRHARGPSCSRPRRTRSSSPNTPTCRRTRHVAAQWRLRRHGRSRRTAATCTRSSSGHRRRYGRHASSYESTGGRRDRRADATSRRIYEFDLHHRTWNRMAADYGTDGRALRRRRPGARLAPPAGHRARQRRRRADLSGTCTRSTSGTSGTDGIAAQDAGRRPGRDPRPGPRVAAADPHRRHRARRRNPFRVACESIEALRVVERRELLLGCDNNFPNTAATRPGRRQRAHHRADPVSSERPGPSASHARRPALVSGTRTTDDAGR